jgi:hypothetical protein
LISEINTWDRTTLYERRKSTRKTKACPIGTHRPGQVAPRSLRPWHVCTECAATHETPWLLSCMREGVANRNREKTLTNPGESEHLIVPMMALITPEERRCSTDKRNEATRTAHSSGIVVETKSLRVVWKHVHQYMFCVDGRAGAVCINSASTVLRGGCPARGTPTRQRTCS